MSSKFLFAAIIAILPLSCIAQPASPVPPQRFSSAVIKPSHASNWGTSVNDGTLQITNLSLKAIIANAYSVREEMISGLPGWAETAHFDIVAKVNEPDIASFRQMSREDRGAMIAALLEDRFRLKLHIQPKTRAIYVLMLAPNGPRPKEHIAKGGAPGQPVASSSAGEASTGPGEFTATDSRMSALSSFLADVVQSTVVDQTGLSGRYDLRLVWAPMGASADPSNMVDSALSSALQQQLGLRLLPAKGPVDTLVVDHVERPSAK